MVQQRSINIDGYKFWYTDHCLKRCTERGIRPNQLNKAIGNRVNTIVDLINARLRIKVIMPYNNANNISAAFCLNSISGAIDILSVYWQDDSRDEFGFRI